MMSNEGYRDRILTCRDCGQDFTFTSGEQEFYASKGLTNTPSRCPSCRAARRGGQASSTSRTSHGETYEATCAQCGRRTFVPFLPREDRPVYCNDCFQTQRAARGRRDDWRSSYSSTSSYSSGGHEGRRDRGRDRRDRGRDRYDDRW